MRDFVQTVLYVEVFAIVIILSEIAFTKLEKPWVKVLNLLRQLSFAIWAAWLLFR